MVPVVVLPKQTRFGYLCPGARLVDGDLRFLRSLLMRLLLPFLFLLLLPHALGEDAAIRSCRFFAHLHSPPFFVAFAAESVSDPLENFHHSIAWLLAQPAPGRAQGRLFNKFLPPGGKNFVSRPPGAFARASPVQAF